MNETIRSTVVIRLTDGERIVAAAHQDSAVPARRRSFKPANVTPTWTPTIMKDHGVNAREIRQEGHTATRCAAENAASKYSGFWTIKKAGIAASCV